MKSIRHSYLTIGAACILFLFCLTAQGQNNEQARHDSIRFSLLTCGPGEEIYSLFGHTAIRYENLTRRIDYVFNYGIFSFNTPNFILRFTLGETDYKLGVAPFDYFTEEYKYLQRDVRQQVLNLNQTEKRSLQPNWKRTTDPRTEYTGITFLRQLCYPSSRPNRKGYRRQHCLSPRHEQHRYRQNISRLTPSIHRESPLVTIWHGSVYGYPCRQTYQPQADDVCSFLSGRML